MKDFSPQGAIQSAHQGTLEEWMDSFLRGEGKNIALAYGLKKAKRYWYGPVQFPLNELIRCCGPEVDIKYHEPQATWDKRVDAIVSHIREGGALAPIIAQFTEDGLSIKDGNHRYAAYMKEGFDKYWTIIWFDDEKDLREFKQKHATKI